LDFLFARICRPFFLFAFGSCPFVFLSARFAPVPSVQFRCARFSRHRAVFSAISMSASVPSIYRSCTHMLARFRCFSYGVASVRWRRCSLAGSFGLLACCSHRAGPSE
jgi:hypothetical protein